MAKKISVRKHIKDPASGSYIEIKAVLGKESLRRLFPLADVNMSPGEIIRWLGSEGISANANVKSELKRALANLPPPIMGRVAIAPGWWGNSFVLPGSIYAAPHDTVVNHSASHEELVRWRRRGTLKGWKKAVAKSFVASPAGVFGICLGFVGPVLRFTPFATITCMLVGPSALGKTSLQHIIGSIWSGTDREFVESLDRSALAAEPALRRARDTILLLDETRLLDGDKAQAGRAVARLIFKFASTAPREVTGVVSAPALLTGARLLSSNLTAAELVRNGGNEFDLQDAVRILELCLDSGKFPVFRFKTKKTEKRARLVDKLRRNVRRNGGVAGSAFVTAMVSEMAVSEKGVQDRIDRYRAEGFAFLKVSPSAPAFEVRMANQVAIVYAAGRLARHHHILPFDRATLTAAAVECWKVIRQSAIQGVGESPMKEFVAKLRQMTLLDHDPKRSVDGKDAAKEFGGFVKTGAGGPEILLSTSAIGKLTPHVEAVVEWLDANGVLKREGKKGKGKRQVRVVVGKDRKARDVRIRVYKILADVDELERLVG